MKRTVSVKISVFNDKNHPFDISEHKLAVTSLITIMARFSPSAPLTPPLFFRTDDEFDRKQALISNTAALSPNWCSVSTETGFSVAPLH